MKQWEAMQGYLEILITRAGHQSFDIPNIILKKHFFGPQILFTQINH